MNASLALLLGTYGRASPVAWAPAGSVTVSLAHTAAGMSIAEWSRTRHAAALAALLRRGVPYEQAWWFAIALIGHYAHETGWGRSETDFALGNIRARDDWPGPVHFLQGSDDPVPAPYRAYATLDEGVEDSVRLAVEGARYRPSAVALLASYGGTYVVSADGRTVAFPMDVQNWYASLTRAGWHPYSEASMQTFRGTVTRAAQAIGAPLPQAVLNFAPVAIGAGIFGAIAGTLAVVFWPSRRSR